MSYSFVKDVSYVDLMLQNRTLGDIKECVSLLREEFQEHGFPIDENSSVLNRLCSKLELLLQLGLKEKSSSRRSKGDYFTFLSEGVRDNKSLNDGVRFVKLQKEYKTRVGQGRALIRYSMVHHLLADSLQHCINNEKLVAKWYARSSSVMNNTELTSELINSLYDLNDVTFDLDPSIHDLDIRWPLSSRSSKNVNSMNMWRPPTRSTSIGSINSINPQDDMLCSSFNTSASFNASFLSSSVLSRDISMEEENEQTTSDVEDQANSTKDTFPDGAAATEKEDFAASEFVGDDAVDYRGLWEKAERRIEELTLQLQQQQQQQRDASCRAGEGKHDTPSSPGCSDGTLDARAAPVRECAECTQAKDELRELERSKSELIGSLDEAARRLNEFEMGESESNFLARAFEDLERDNENLREMLVVMERDKQQAEDALNGSLVELERRKSELEQVKLSCEESGERAKKLEKNYAHLVNFAQRASDLCPSRSQSRSMTKALSKSLETVEKTDKSSLDEILIRLDESIRCNSWSENISFINDRSSQTSKVSKSRGFDAELNRAKREAADLRAQLLEKVNEIAEMKDQMERQNEVNATLVRVKDSVVQRLNSEVEKGKETERELRRDMEEMTGSFKRREILMEEARTGFERSRLLEYDQWNVEVESLKQIIQDLESKIAKDLTLEKKREYEENMIKLEDTIVCLKEELANLKQQHDEWVRNMNNRLEDLEGENVSLRNQVSQMTRYEKQMREEFRQKESDWSSLEARLRSDITSFKMRVGKLVKDKEKLWQVNDRLKDREAAASSFRWVDSSTVAHCHLCNAAFSLAVRKHHCRRCGNVMCSTCCSNWMDLPHSSAKVRVCNSCKDFINSTKYESTSSDILIQCNGEDEVARKDPEIGTGVGASYVGSGATERSDDGSDFVSSPSSDDNNANDGEEDVTENCDVGKSDDDVFNGGDGGEGGGVNELSSCRGDDVINNRGDDVNKVEDDQSETSAAKKFYVGDQEPVGGDDDDDVAKDLGRSERNEMSSADDVSFVSEKQLSSNGLHQDNNLASTPEPPRDPMKGTVAIAIHPSAFSKLTGGMRSAASWVTSAAAASLMRTTSHVSGIFGLGQSPIQGDDDNTYLYDDRYEYLSPEEIIHSRIFNSTADDSIVIADVINRPGTMTNDSFELVRDLLPDKILVVPVYLGVEDGRATAMHWSFHSEPKGIKFSISYQKTAEHLPISTSPPRSGDFYPTGLDTNPMDDPKKRHISNLSYLTSSMIHPFSGSSGQDLGWTTSASLPDMETILPMTKVQSDLKNVSGCLVPKSSGVYIFIFDHTRSSLLTKKIFLQLILVSQSIVESPAAEEV